MSDVRQRENQTRVTTRIRHFRDLLVWQKAFQLGLDVYVCSKTWPGEERYSLTDQVRRSARSVSANIAEAWGKRRYEAHFVSKLSDADTELHETENWLMFAREHGYIDTSELAGFREHMDEIGRMLGSMMANPSPFILKSSVSEL